MNEQHLISNAVTRLVIFKPGQTLCGEHEPVLLGSSFDQADVVDG